MARSTHRQMEFATRGLHREQVFANLVLARERLPAPPLQSISSRPYGLDPPCPNMYRLETRCRRSSNLCDDMLGIPTRDADRTAFVRRALSCSLLFAL